MGIPRVSACQVFLFIMTARSATTSKEGELSLFKGLNSDRAIQKRKFKLLRVEAGNLCSQGNPFSTKLCHR